MTAVEYEDNESKFIRKAKENPFVPAGKPIKHHSLMRRTHSVCVSLLSHMALY